MPDFSLRFHQPLMREALVPRVSLGQSSRGHSAIAGHPSASGYAPGRLKKAGSARGASAYAPRPQIH